jgi:hypothetical protein
MNPLKINATILTSAYQHKTAESGLAEVAVRRLMHSMQVPDARPPLGPVFDGINGDNWNTHIETVCSFPPQRIDRCDGQSRCQQRPAEQDESAKSEDESEAFVETIIVSWDERCDHAARALPCPQERSRLNARPLCRAT